MLDLLKSLVQAICFALTTVGIWIAAAIPFLITQAIVAPGQQITQPRLFFVWLCGLLLSATLSYYLCRFVWDIDEQVEMAFDDFRQWYQSIGKFWQGVFRSSVSAILMFIVAWLLGIPSDYKVIVIPLGSIIIYLGISAVF